MNSDNKTSNAQDGLSLKKESPKIECEKVDDGEYVKINHREIVNRERELHEKMELKQDMFTGIMVRASAAIAEYRAKSKLIVAFQNGMISYAEKLAHYNIEKSNLESRIKHLKTEIEPVDKIINKIKDDINKNIFLYNDKNSCINDIFTEIEKILFEYKRKIESDEFENIVFDKKALLRRMCEEIEDLEIRITSMELEKLSRLNDIQPRIDEIRILDLQLKYLQNESTQKELLGLLSITGNSMKNYEDCHEEKPDIISTEFQNLNSHLIQNQKDPSR